MTKLIWGVLSTFLMFFVVWVSICYVQYGNDFINHHLDFVATFNNMFNVPKVDTSQFSDIFRNFRDGFSNVGKYVSDFMAWTESDWGIFETLKMIFTGISYIARAIYYIYNIINFLFNLLVILVDYVRYSCDLLVNIIVCFFNPVFI